MLQNRIPNRETIFQRCKIEFQIGEPFFNVAKPNPKTGIYKIKKTGIPQIEKPQKEENEHSPFREFVDFWIGMVPQ
jgi:hypothetical protein